MNATHDVKVVKVNLRKHPNADTLSIADIDGWTCVVRTADFEPGSLGVWVPPDNLVRPSVKGFGFLAPKMNPQGQVRIKAVKLRGEKSFGLLIPLSSLEENLHSNQEGDILTEVLKVEHYEPFKDDDTDVIMDKKIGLTTSSVSVPDILDLPKYDLEPFRTYHKNLQEGELVFIREKMDGTSARACVLLEDGTPTLYVGSRTRWVKEFDDNSHITFDYLKNRGVSEEDALTIVERLRYKRTVRELRWAALKNSPELLSWLFDNPGLVAYFEVAGNTNCIKYGFQDSEFGINYPFLFDVWDTDNQEWWNADRLEEEAHKKNLPVCSLIFSGPYSFEKVVELSEGKSISRTKNSGYSKEGTIREGVVISPKEEREFLRRANDPFSGNRLKLKSVSVNFLEKYR